MESILLFKDDIGDAQANPVFVTPVEHGLSLDQGALRSGRSSATVWADTQHARSVDPDRGW